MLSLTKTLFLIVLPIFVLCATLAPQKALAAGPEGYANVAAFQADCTGDDLSKNCEIVTKLLLFINVLSGLVGVVTIIMIIIGGIQYSTAGSDPQKVQAAKSKITNAVIALLIFIFMFSFLQWVVPGGLF